MLTLSYIQENADHIIERLKVRNKDFTDTINQIKQLDEERRSKQQEVNNAQAELNTLSKQIGKLFKEGRQEEASQAKEKNAAMKESIKFIKDQLVVRSSIPMPLPLHLLWLG